MNIETMTLDELKSKYDEVAIEYDILMYATNACSEWMARTSGEKYREHRKNKDIIEDRLKKVQVEIDILQFNIDVEEQKLKPESGEIYSVERPFEGLCIPGN